MSGRSLHRPGLMQCRLTWIMTKLFTFQIASRTLTSASTDAWTSLLAGPSCPSARMDACWACRPGSGVTFLLNEFFQDKHAPMKSLCPHLCIALCA